MGEIVRLSSIRRLGFPKRLRISLICFDDLATSFVNLVNFGLVTPEFKIDKDVHFVVLFKKKQFRHIISVPTGPIFTLDIVGS